MMMIIDDDDNNDDNEDTDNYDAPNYHYCLVSIHSFMQTSVYVFILSSILTILTHM